MYASLADWRTGEIVKGKGGRVGAKFEGNLFVNTYITIAKDLDDLKVDHRIAFHGIMSTLYDLVV